MRSFRIAYLDMQISHYALCRQIGISMYLLNWVSIHRLISKPKPIFLSPTNKKTKMNYTQLAEEAIKAKSKAHPPYSNFHVGAALAYSR